jgi:hypothetical protein
MKITEILRSGKAAAIQNIDVLAEDYLSKLGKKVCKTCPASIILMILELKNHYNMTNFEFAKAKVQYKSKKGDKETISNSTMTDKKAIAFLRENPERIRLFSKYPKNWESLISGTEEETKEEEEKRLAIEAELKASREAVERGNTENLSEEELSKMSLKELRELFPNVKARSIEEFVAEVVASRATE